MRERPLIGGPNNCPETSVEKTKRTIRTENPLLLPLVHSPESYQHFTDEVNFIAAKHGISPIPQPREEIIHTESGGYRYTVLRFPEANKTTPAIESLACATRELYENTEISPKAFTRKHKVTRKTKDKGYIIPKNPGDESSSQEVVGTVVGKDYTELRYKNSENPPSEVEFGYEALITSMINAGKLDLSTKEGLEKTKNLRREIFIDLYQKMLEGMIPVVPLDQMYGVESQVAEIDTNLYKPLASGKGVPMNTLLVGAPGVGKSLVSRYFMGKDQVLTIPLPISNLKDGLMEGYILPRLNRIKNALDIPVVVHLDDVEILMESNIEVDGFGNTIQSIDTRARSRTLNLLERMQDTYGVFLLCTLNHPDMEAAFLRRFHPVYFPLPSGDDRRKMLEGTLPIDGLDEDGIKKAIEKIVAATKGFNYNSLALLPDYIANKQNSDPARDESFEDHINNAIEWAKARASVKKTQAIDTAAKKMVGIIKDQDSRTAGFYTSPEK